METIDNNRWTEISQQKKKLGYRDVRSSLEYLLFTAKTPRVALLISDKVELTDMFRGIVKSVSDKMAFNEFKTNLSNARNVVNKLNMLARTDCNLVVIVGADDVFALENVEMLAVLSQFPLPTTLVTEHYSQLRYLPTVVDMLVSTPDDLARFVASMVQRVSTVLTSYNEVGSVRVSEQETDAHNDASMEGKTEVHAVVVEQSESPFVPLCKDDEDHLARQLQSLEQQTKEQADRMAGMIRRVRRSNLFLIIMMILVFVMCLLQSLKPFLF